MKRASLGFTITLMACACSARPVTSDDETSSSMEDGEGEGDGDGAMTTGHGADLPAPGGQDDACGCEAGQLCVGDCIWHDFNPNMVGNSRCIDAVTCDEHGIDSPECMELACGAPWSKPLDGCGPAGATNGYDIVCNPDNPVAWCDETTQDCPDGEKCVIRPPDRWGHHTARCVPVTGTGAAGEPCTSEGASPDSTGTDSCDATSMCWSGSLSTEPFEGTCQGFCADIDDSSACPEQTSCALIEGSFWLCVP